MRWSLLTFCIAAIYSCSDPQYDGLEQVKDFGSNPGSLLMYRYVSPNAISNAPLVVVMHGCSQNALEAAELTGWNLLAERFGFHILYPQQCTQNNISDCFNWFDDDDIKRGHGEAASIAQMVNRMKTDLSIAPDRVFVTGLSAGGAMAAVMLACYPDVYRAGAIMAGGPYFAATDVLGSVQAMLGNVTKPAEEWGNLVRDQNPNWGPVWPRVMIVHGESDNVVNPANARELAKQWTNVHGIDDQPDQTTTFDGAPDVLWVSYLNSQNQELVGWLRVNSLGHALPVWPGICRNQGGQTGTFGTDKQFWSTYWAAQFFDIVPKDVVAGPTTAIQNSTVTYWATAHSNSTYAWQVPNGWTLIAGNGTAQASVLVGTESGTVSVIETDANGCTYAHQGIQISVQ